MITNPNKWKQMRLREILFGDDTVTPCRTKTTSYHRLDRTVLVFCVRFGCWVLWFKIPRAFLNEWIQTQFKWNSDKWNFVLVTTIMSDEDHSVPQTWPYNTRILCEIWLLSSWFKIPRVFLKEWESNPIQIKNNDLRDICFGDQDQRHKNDWVMRSMGRRSILSHFK